MAGSREVRRDTSGKQEKDGERGGSVPPHPWVEPLALVIEGIVGLRGLWD
jgi:hypothetical protein